MPAAAVIPALLVYIKVVAVKKLVVECRLNLSNVLTTICKGSTFCGKNHAFTRVIFNFHRLH